MRLLSIATVVALTSTLAFSFDFGSFVNTTLETATKPTKEAPITKESLSESTIIKGLKEALQVGVNYGVKELSKENGYLNNSSVKIPLPENLAKAETLIRKAGGDKMADELILSMNKAATQAAPKTADIFMKSIKDMSMADAQKILDGDKDSATNYFKNSSTSELKKMIAPIVQQTMKDCDVATYYKTFNTYYKEYGKGIVDNSSVMGMAKSFGVDSYLPSTSDENLDEYVTQKAIDGLFKMIATKEGEIRANPIAQTSSLLKQVFGN